ncbi:nucleobase:cation symporter-2 family protein [Alcaligenes sp. SDU_A2]|uniref:nucleobase:cation symporter-2 family protein n=1 Tax=Alcaligenes sp. SDU_A2 TaxID=3136634 RepID=UPI002B58F3BB|nr:nucleobase:cation symporter-2 family protein [Alcaligenes sp.]HRL27245.1 nucleobase:cation symporter-2 family protein [Alcaligenes sp.]
MSANPQVSQPDPCGGVDERLPLGQLATLGLQHVMVMYAGAVAVPLIIGAALGLSKEQIALLINADLLCCGLITIIQARGMGVFGIRLPVMMGVSFAAVSPMIAIGLDPELGLTGIFGATILAGIFSILIAPVFSRMMGLFPPVVTGIIITVIGITLMRVGLDWVGGGKPQILDTATGQMIANPDYGSLENLAIAMTVLTIILVITKFARGFLANVAVLIGLLAGFFISLGLGRISFAGLDQASWFAVVTPFEFGVPTFSWGLLGAAAVLSLIMVVIMVESLGMFLALGSICGRPPSREDLVRGLRTDGLGTLVGGIMNTFPHSSFSQNVGLVSVTGVRSRWVCVMGGVFLMALGLFPKMAFVVASIPNYVLGGAGIVMFGMVAATGIKILMSANLNRNRYNPYIIAISLGFGMIPLVAEHLLDKMPAALAPLLHSGILLAAVSAIVLNLFFNGIEKFAGQSHEVQSTAAEAQKQENTQTADKERRLASQH